MAKIVQATTHWDLSTTPNMTAEVQLVKKNEVEGSTVAEYRLKVTGAPHNQPYPLIGWPVTIAGPAPMIDGLAVAQDGTVGCPGEFPGKLCATLQGRRITIDL